MILQKKSSILSKPVMQCVDYIYSHIKERITIQVLADHTGLSTNYLSRIFKQNLGVSVSDYIREQKIEKSNSSAAILKQINCRYRKLSCIFFTESLHPTFENFTGLTPKKYRDKYYKACGKIRFLHGRIRRFSHKKYCQKAILFLTVFLSF